MSELILIRHGQATPFEADTDQLSELGHAQARAVGGWLAAQGVRPTHVLHGPMVRQRLSAREAVQAATLAVGEGWPEATEDPRLAEFDGDGLFGRLAPLLAAQSPDFAALAQAYEARRRTPERNAAFQRLLEALADGWQSARVTHPEVEAWADFRARVHSALADVLKLPSGSTVLAFTSGGVIGLCAALSLDAPDAAALKLNWRVKNASLTRLTFGGGRLSLDTFNEEGHLPPELRSWR